jgi:hypothetical protein
MSENVLQKEGIIDNALQVISEWSGKTPEKNRDYPDFDFNGLATHPTYLDRGWLGLFGQLKVLPGTCAVVTGREGFQRVYEPGIHFLFNVPLGPAMVQVVNTTRQRREIPPVTFLSKDKWSVTLRAVVDFEVEDPLIIAQSANPLETLDAVATSCIMAQIEAMPHDALTGLLEEEPSGLDTVAKGILDRLCTSPDLDGLRIIGVSIVERKGDERRIEIVRDAVVERTRLAEESRLRRIEDEAELEELENQKRIAKKEQEVEMIKVQTEVHRAEEMEKLKLLSTQVEAQIEEIRRAQEEWWAAKEVEILRMIHQHEENLAIIKGTAQITTEAAKSGHLEALKVSPRRRPELAILEGARQEVVEEGIQAMKAFRERKAPASYLLPHHSVQGRYYRLQQEEMRLSKIKGAEYEIVMKRGGSFNISMEVAGHRFKMECPEAYPSEAPKVTITYPDGQEKPFSFEWDRNTFLSDLVQCALIESAFGSSS